MLSKVQLAFFFCSSILYHSIRAGCYYCRPLVAGEVSIVKERKEETSREERNSIENSLIQHGARLSRLGNSYRAIYQCTSLLFLLPPLFKLNQRQIQTLLLCYEFNMRINRANVPPRFSHANPGKQIGHCPFERSAAAFNGTEFLSSKKVCVQWRTKISNDAAWW